MTSIDAATITVPDLAAPVELLARVLGVGFADLVSRMVSDGIDAALADPDVRGLRAIERATIAALAARAGVDLDEEIACLASCLAAAGVQGPAREPAFRNWIDHVFRRVVASAEARHAERECRLLGLDTPWPLASVLQRLAEAAEHLLAVHDCDEHGYEGVAAAVQAALRLQGVALGLDAPEGEGKP